MRILYIGDIVGEMGISYLKEMMPQLRNEYKPNLIFVNGENATKGKGLSLKDYKEIMSCNVSGITMGNHTFRNPEINEYITNSKIARPMNMDNVLGNGYLDVNFNGQKITIINLIGTLHMKLQEETKNPYQVIDAFLKKHSADYTIVDFHAETTSEKIAMGYFLDGRVSAVLGTHTHVQTNDARVLPKKTLYVSDIGMTGPLNGVLGVQKDIIIDRLANDGKSTFQLADDGHTQLNGVLLDINDLKPKITLFHYEK